MNIIEVQPYLIKENLVKLNVTASLDNVKDTFPSDGAFKINLYNVELSDGKILIPRKTSSFLTLEIEIEWASGDAMQMLADLIAANEDAEDVLSLQLRASCPKTFWSSKQEKLKVSEVGKKNITLKIAIADIAEQIFIESYFVRERGISQSQARKAAFPYSIVSRNDEISVQVDFIEPIGGNHLPIEPKDLKNLLFKLEIEDPYAIPIIYYAEELEKVFKRDDLHTVNTAFLMIMPGFLDTYLKWLIFYCQPDQTNKEQKSLADKIAKLTGTNWTDIYDIMSSGKEEKIDKYLELSKKLFEGIQTKSSINYKQELEKYINQERKLKKEIQ